MKKGVKVFLLALTFLLFVSATGMAYAWYLSQDKREDLMQMGVVDIAIDQAEHEVSLSSNTAAFTLTNQSNIDYFLRLPYTVIFKDSSGKDLPKNTPNDLIAVTLTGLSLDGSVPNYSQNSYTTYLSNSYEKQGIDLINAQNGGYLVFPSEKATINVEVSLAFNTAKYPEYFTNGVLTDQMFITFIPEAIQGSKKAVGSAAAQEVGWNLVKVIEEGRTIEKDDII